MAKRILPCNIERSAFRRGEYVGYSALGSVRIRRGGKGWETYNHNGSYRSYRTARTLMELGEII